MCCRWSPTCYYLLLDISLWRCRSPYSVPSGSPHSWSTGSPLTGTSHSARSCRHPAPSCGHISHNCTLKNTRKLTKYWTSKGDRCPETLIKVMGKKCPDEKLVLLKIYSSVTGISFITKKQGRKTPMWKQQKKRSFPSSSPLSFCFCFSGSWTYLSQTWSVHIQSGPSLHSERSPHGQQGWRCQNLIQKKTVSNLLLHCTANKISGINTMWFYQL